MADCTSPVAKRARKSPPRHQTGADSERPNMTAEHIETAREGEHTQGEEGSPEATTRGNPRSMTARSRGAADEGEDDPLFDAPLSPGEVCPGLLRTAPPSVSEEAAARAVLDHAKHHPGSIRSWAGGRRRSWRKWSATTSCR